MLAERPEQQSKQSEKLSLGASTLEKTQCVFSALEQLPLKYVGIIRTLWPFGESGTMSP